MKQIAFYLSVPLIFAAAIVLGSIAFIASVLQGVIAVFEVLILRWECWTGDVKPGEIINCPWQQSIIEVFGDAYEGY